MNLFLKEWERKNREGNEKGNNCFRNQMKIINLEQVSLYNVKSLEMLQRSSFGADVVLDTVHVCCLHTPPL